MQFLFSAEQREFRNRARSWISSNLPDAWRHHGKAFHADVREEVGIHLEWERKLFEHGWAGIHWPVQHGGRGLGLVEHLVFQQELGISGAPEGINGIGRELVGPILLALGTSEQKDRHLSRILSCEEVWCQGFSEPGAGSDLGALRTRAARTASGWQIEGQKVWTSHARHAQFCLLLARAAAESGERGHIAMFIMPMNTPGVQVRPIRQINGKDDFCEVFIDGALLENEALVGTVEEGWRAANDVLSVERGINKMYRQAAFLGELIAIHRLCEAQQARLSAQGLLQSFRGRVAALFGQLQVVGYRNLALVSRMARGESLGSETSVHKLFWSELHQDVTELGLDLLNALGQASAVNGAAAQRLLYAYLASRAETIFAGTSQIQRDIIAQRVLELPRT